MIRLHKTGTVAAEASGTPIACDIVRSYRKDLDRLGY
jgi:hypothetical protein